MCPLLGSPIVVVRVIKQKRVNTKALRLADLGRQRAASCGSNCSEEPTSSILPKLASFDSNQHLPRHFGVLISSKGSEQCAAIFFW